MNIVLTSGGAQVPIDRVRHIGNMSHGTFGAKIAREIMLFPEWNCNLTFLRAKRSEAPFRKTINWYGIHEENQVRATTTDLMAAWHAYMDCRHRYTELTYKTFNSYCAELGILMANKPDMVILAAAISDYLVKNYVDGKIRSKNALNIELDPAPKIISAIKQTNPECILIGYKLLVDSTEDELVAAAKDSAIKNQCAFVVANDLRDIVAGDHQLRIITKTGLHSVWYTRPDDPNYLAHTVAKLAYNFATHGSI